MRTDFLPLESINLIAVGVPINNPIGYALKVRPIIDKGTFFLIASNGKNGAICA